MESRLVSQLEGEAERSWNDMSVEHRLLLLLLVDTFVESAQEGDPTLLWHDQPQALRLTLVYLVERTRTTS